nr:unnamed protein product [Spirometra erinaceieuropaei]
MHCELPPSTLSGLPVVIAPHHILSNYRVAVLGGVYRLPSLTSLRSFRALLAPNFHFSSSEWLSSVAKRFT